MKLEKDMSRSYMMKRNKLRITKEYSYDDRFIKKASVAYFACMLRPHTPPAYPARLTDENSQTKIPYI
jgi:hypothetical protein